MNVYGPKNKTNTMMWDVQVERAFFLPSKLLFHRECELTIYKLIRIIKLPVQMAPLLNSTSRVIT